MGFWKGLKETANNLNNGVRDLTNSEKAKSFRKKMLIWGTALTIAGIVGMILGLVIIFSKIAGMISSTTSTIGSSESFRSVSSAIPGNVFAIFIWFLLDGLFGVVLALGISLIRIGLSIVLTGYTSEAISKIARVNCPNCGDPMEEGETFCSKCGASLKPHCPQCGAENSSRNQFCTSCGAKLKE